MAPRRHRAPVSCGTSTTARRRADEQWSFTWVFPSGLSLRSAISVVVAFGRSSGHQVAVLVWPNSPSWWPRPHIAFYVMRTTIDVITDYSQDEVCDHFVSTTLTLW